MGKKFVGLGGLKHFWTKAKTWIAGQITAEVTAKIAEIVANAPEDLDTLKEIADWIKTHANDASAMNTQINTNKNDIAALQTSVAGKAAASHTHDDRYYTESEVDKKLAGKSNVEHTHTKSEITDFPTSLKNPNALTVNGKTYDGSTAVDAGVQKVANGGTGVTTQSEINKAFIGILEEGDSDVTDGTEFVSSYASDNGFSEPGVANKPYKRKFSKVWNYIKGKISSVLGLTKDNYGGKAATAGTADSATRINYTGESSGCISARQTNESYNDSSADWASYIICNHGNGTTYYHQMLRLSFSSDTIQLQRRVAGKLQGWKNVAIMENENTWSSRQNFTTAKASNKMVIPIGAPSQLEDGCIWIER